MNEQTKIRKRGTLAKVFMAMLAFSALDAKDNKSVNVGVGGIGGSYGWNYFPIGKRYRKQKMEKARRRNIQLHPKGHKS